MAGWPSHILTGTILKMVRNGNGKEMAILQKKGFFGIFFLLVYFLRHHPPPIVYISYSMTTLFGQSEKVIKYNWRHIYKFGGFFPIF